MLIISTSGPVAVKRFYSAFVSKFVYCTNVLRTGGRVITKNRRRSDLNVLSVRVRWQSNCHVFVVMGPSCLRSLAIIGWCIRSHCNTYKLSVIHYCYIYNTFEMTDKYISVCAAMTVTLTQWPKLTKVTLQRLHRTPTPPQSERKQQSNSCFLSPEESSAQTLRRSF